MRDMLISLAVVLVLIAGLGALLGGESFGSSLRKGCGCGVGVLIAVLLALFLLFSLFLFA